MKYVICTIYDSKAMMHSLPAVYVNKPVARRAFEDMCANKDSVYGQHPDDFVLVTHGTFDSDTGAFELFGE